MRNIDLLKISRSIRTLLVPDKSINTVAQHALRADSPKLQDSYNMALSWMLLHMGQIEKHLHAH